MNEKEREGNCREREGYDEIRDTHIIQPSVMRSIFHLTIKTALQNRNKFVFIYNLRTFIFINLLPSVGR